MKDELIVSRSPKSPISEIFRTLRTNIQFMSAKDRLKTILITSTLPEEGKSWVSSNLACTFAQAGKSVLLVDADMRKGRQYTIFGVAPTPGLSNYLSGVDEKGEANDDISHYIQKTEVDNLYIMVAGNVPPNPSELLGTERMEDLLNKLKQSFDIVIIDGTPNQLVADSLVLTRLVDSTVIVTASKKTKKEDLKRIVNNIKQVGGKIAGIVVNKITVSTKSYGQSYYYGNKDISTKVKKKNKIGVNDNLVKPEKPKSKDVYEPILDESIEEDIKENQPNDNNTENNERNNING